MRIAQVVCVFPPYKSGVGNVAYNFAKIAKEYGHASIVLTPAYSGQSVTSFVEGFSLKRIKPFLKFGKGAFLPQILRDLKTIDIVHLHYPFFGGAEVIWLAKFLNKNKRKLIIHYHMDVNGFGLFNRILSIPSSLIFPSLFKNAEAISYATLDYIKNSAIKNIYEARPDKFFEIPLGVDANLYCPNGNKKNSEFNSIIFIGGLDKAHFFKGVDVLLEAFSRLQQKNNKLIIIGNGELLPSYKKKAIDLKISEKIEFITEADDQAKSEILKNASLLVLPSINTNEAFGLVLLEAMSSGIPIIASELPGVRSVFKNGEQGLLAKTGDSEDLKNKIDFILTDKEKMITMGERARQLVLEKYTWEKIGKKLNQLYTKIYHENKL